MTLESIKRNLLLSRTFIAIIVICSIAISLNDIFYRRLDRDEFYMALNMRDYMDNPMAPLTFYIGHITSMLFGDNLIVLRILKYVIYFITIGIGCIFFYNKTRKIAAAWYLFALFALASSVATIDIYNWDSGSYPFIVLTLISTLAYKNHQSPNNVIIMGICCSLMIASRIVTAVAVPFLVLLIFISHYPIKRKLRDTVLLLAILCFTLLMLMLLIYGSSSSFLSAWSSDNIINGHGTDAESIARIISSLRHRSLNVILVWMLATVCFVTSTVALRMHRHKFTGIVIMAVIISLFTRPIILSDPWGLHVSLWQIPAFLFLFMPQISHFFGLGRHNDSAKISLTQWIILLFILVPGVGSDHFYERIAPMVLMPLILAYNYAQKSKLVITVCGTMGIAILTIAMHNTITRYNNSSLVNLATLSPRSGNIYYYPRWALIDQHRDIYNLLTEKGYSPTYIGNERYAYTYLFCPDNSYSLAHFHYLKFANEQRYLKKLNDFNAVVVNEPVYADSSDNVAFRSYLHSLGFRDSTQAFTHLPSTTHIYLR